MKKQNILISVLIMIILIFGALFALKYFGIVKMEPIKFDKAITDTTEKLNTASNNQLLDSFSGSSNGILRNNSSGTNTALVIVVAIVILAILCVFTIGLGKVYSKLGMPKWCVNITQLMPLLYLCLFFLMVILQSVMILAFALIIVFFIITLVINMNYFKALGMSKWWPLVAFIPYVGSLILFVVAIIANINLGKAFNKSTGFILGIVLLPIIFIPILGYQKDDGVGQKVHQY